MLKPEGMGRDSHLSCPIRRDVKYPVGRLFLSSQQLISMGPREPGRCLLGIVFADARKNG